MNFILGVLMESTEFSSYIEKYAVNNDVTNFEAILLYAEENFVDVTELATMITQTLKDKIEVELEKEGMLKITKQTFKMDI